jgi:hypothetical protein
MKKNILVTGSHRSGSTWTGKVIAKAKNVRYVKEPFNIGNKRNNPPFSYWFEHLNDASAIQQQKTRHYINSFNEILHFNNFKKNLKIWPLKEMYRFFLDIKHRITDRTIYKDPIAVMSAEWIFENYNWDIIVLIRHPAAFVASLKVKDWRFDFNNFLKQEKLMKNYLYDYKDIIEDYSKNRKDIIDQGILLWNTIHDTIDYYKKKYNDIWLFVKHEDLSKNTIPEFRKIFSKINLKFDDNVEKYLLESINSNKNSYLKRDSVKNIKSWKQRLSADEIERVKIGTRNVWTKFYSEEDW